MANTATPTQCLPPLLPERTLILSGAAMCLCKQAHLPWWKWHSFCQWLMAEGFWGKLLSNGIRLCPYLLPACSCRSRAVSEAAISQARKCMHQNGLQHAEDEREEKPRKSLGGHHRWTASPAMGCLLPVFQNLGRKVPMWLCCMVIYRPYLSMYTYIYI